MINKLSKNSFFKIVFILIFFTLGIVRSEPIKEVKNISMIELIANPEKFNGKHVRLIGYSLIKFEVHGVFVSENDAKHSIMKNGLWIVFANIELNKYKKLNEKYILIEGIFDSHKKGHFGMYSGEIRDIGRLELWVNTN